MLSCLCSNTGHSPQDDAPAETMVSFEELYTNNTGSEHRVLLMELNAFCYALSQTNAYFWLNKSLSGLVMSNKFGMNFPI